jgi:hypothetical protein
MVVTLSGITIFGKLEHPIKAWYPIEVKVLESCTLFKVGHPLKAYSPIIVVLVTNFSNFPQFSNALLLIY